ncbi:hypothetical protein Rxyl_2218 [Rubrobacter xylanophilus DSM 9941]|uniref:Uncharacterized protein n=2 Tax=Rubrobacter xylanophilus TaxID=49319 RepID=Q1ATW9_RUBXD|nr:hypothetical protein Rxyl_2218 [Rubrobacter xylanophilus DSM 9941]
MPESFDVYLESIERLAARLNGDFEVLVRGSRAAWSHTYRAYAGQVDSTSPLDPVTGQALVSTWQKNIEAEMKKYCERATKPELFFCARLMTPEHLRLLRWNSIETQNSQSRIIAMAVRRIATHAALLYGRKPPGRYDAEYGGVIAKNEQERFARTFLSLLNLAETYFESALYKVGFGLGLQMRVSEKGFRPLEGDFRQLNILTASLDERKHRYFSPFSPVGEFSKASVSVPDPYEGPERDNLGNRVGLFSSHYEIAEDGRSGYRFQAWLLKALEDFLALLNPDLVRDSWDGLGREEFVALLAGLCSLVRAKLEDPERLEAAHVASVVPLTEFEIEGNTLIDSAADHAARRGMRATRGDLKAARDRFLYLSTSTGKEKAREDHLKIDVGDTRYSYLLHKFGKVYMVDLFHADHWLHRPLDLLAEGMKGGKEGRLKGARVEGQVWDFMGTSDKIQRVEALKGIEVRKQGQPFNDLDCPLRVGDTLVLAEVKGKLLDPEVEEVGYEYVKGRWKENLKFLKKIDETAELVAQRHRQPNYKEGMRGIKRILPVVCRPYPEWIPSTEARYWLQEPGENDRGIPRVLTPQELKDFLERLPSPDQVNLPPDYIFETGKQTE